MPALTEATEVDAIAWRNVAADTIVLSLVAVGFIISTAVLSSMELVMAPDSRQALLSTTGATPLPELNIQRGSVIVAGISNAGASQLCG